MPGFCRHAQFALLCIIVSAQVSFAQKTVTGVVRDEDGVPLRGATVLMEGNQRVALTDDRGRFSLLVEGMPPFVVVVRCVGYSPERVTATNLEQLDVVLTKRTALGAMAITARRREEEVRDVPIPVTVVSGERAEDAGAFNVNRVKELIPSVQLYSSNPRNTTLNIRGLGSTFGLTNDGIDPGVGFYLDGVYFARPAVTALDLVDVERIEVLRGPQGTLFGKNTTAGAFNVTTRRPKFAAEGTSELSAGNVGFVQAKASITGPLSKRVAARGSFSATQRDGLLTNSVTQQRVNDLDNFGVRGQVLFVQSPSTNLLFSADLTTQRPAGYAQVLAGVVQTQRAEFRQFDAIASDLGYTAPGLDPYRRVIDHDTPWRSNNQLGGASLTVEAQRFSGTITSTTAWRHWLWDPSNDRDFTGLPVLTRSEAPSRHRNWSQEVRYAGSINSRVEAVAGLFAMGQLLTSDPVHTEESGAAQWRFAQNSLSELWATSGLLDGYGIRTTNRLNSTSAAAFGQLDIKVNTRARLLAGLRYNYDYKDVAYQRQTYGGLETADPDLLAIKRQVYSDQAFTTEVTDRNVSGQATALLTLSSAWNGFLTYATSYKPVGVNLGGLPTANGEPLLELATVKRERVRHIEVGFKGAPGASTLLNFTVYRTAIADYQTLVQVPQLGVNRGYLANAPAVQVQGVEVDAMWELSRTLSVTGAVSYTDGVYSRFPNAPVPLEETGAAVAFKDISGSRLPGISRWAGSFGAEYQTRESEWLGQRGRLSLSADLSCRSGFSSSPSPSRFLNVDAYALANGRISLRANAGTTLLFWVRNAFDRNYAEQLLPGAGNAGHYAAVLGDPRTFGVTVRRTL